MLSGGTRRALPCCYQSEEMKILNISFLPVGIQPTTCRVVSRTFVTLCHDTMPDVIYKLIIYIHANKSRRPFVAQFLKVRPQTRLVVGSISYSILRKTEMLI